MLHAIHVHKLNEKSLSVQLLQKLLFSAYHENAKSNRLNGNYATNNLALINNLTLAEA
jgi:hypothetical protein